MTSPSPDRLFLLLLLAALVAFYFPGLLPGRILLPVDILCSALPWSATAGCAGVTPANPIISDQVFQFFPWRSVVRAGGWGAVFWNPYNFGGSPLLANGQSALLYPPNWLHLLLPPAWSYVLLAMLRTALALGFTWLFARRHVSAPAAALAAAAYGFSYTFVFSLGFPLGDAVSLMPALFWALDARRWWALAAATALELLAGQPETALVVFLAAGAYFLARWPSRCDLLRAAGAVLLGALVAAPQIFLLLQYLGQSAASRLRAEYNPLFYSAHTLLEFLTPEFFGTSSPAQRWASNEGGYFGFLPALLVLGWALSSPRKAARNPFLWIFLGSLAFIYRVPPLAWLLQLPHLRTIFVTKFWAGATFAGAMLAAFAWDDFLERRIRFSLLLLLSLAGGLLLLFARWHFRDFINALGLVSFENWVLLKFGFFLALSLLALRFRPSLAVVVLLVESYVYLGRYNTAAPVSLLYPRTPVVDFLRRDPERARIMGDGVLPPNTSAVFGLEDVRGYDAVTSWAYFRYMTAIDPSFPDLWPRLNLNAAAPNRETLYLRDRFERPLQEWGRGYRDFLRRVYYWNDRLARVERPALLDLLNVKYFLVSHGGKPPPGTENYRLAYSGEVDAWENPNRLPRAFVVSAWEPVADEESALTAIRHPNFDPRKTAILCCGPPNPPLPTPNPQEFRAAEILSYTAGEVVIRATGPGALVLADASYPGWRAEGYAIYRADYLFRAVLLPAGAHTLRFYYRPSLDF